MKNESLRPILEMPKEEIANRIFNVRGLQVMLDSDIAELFELPVRRINEQMKRNPDRFPKDFCFELSEEEYLSLRSQIATFKQKTFDRKYVPYVYTEHGIIALSGVLRYGVANRMSVEISRVFVSMRRFIAQNGDVLRKLGELQDRQLAFENETTKKLDALFSYVDDKAFPKSMTFFNGQWFDAYDFLSSLFEKADSSVLLIDPYCDRGALKYCAKAKAGVSVSICHGPMAGLCPQDIAAYSRQYGAISTKVSPDFHDRYLILDGKECYHIGTSLNHAGKKVFGMERMEDLDVISLLVQKAS